MPDPGLWVKHRRLCAVHPAFLILASAPDAKPHNWPLHTDSAVTVQTEFMRIPFLVVRRIQIDRCTDLSYVLIKSLKMIEDYIKYNKNR